MYAKNEVSRYKTKKKTIWDCTLPLTKKISLACLTRSPIRGPETRDFFWPHTTLFPEHGV